MAAIDRVRPLVEPIVADLGLDLYDLEHVGGVVRVTLDKPGGVDLEAIALVTRLVSRELDHHDPITGRYTLEVSSPGLERNLRTPDHFQRVVGWKVNVRTQANVEGDRRAIGALTAADAKSIVVATEAGERRIAYHDIDRAKTVFEWTVQNAPAKKAAAKKITANKIAAPKKATQRTSKKSTEATTNEVTS